MKKYMIMCMAVVALLFASCKNEDISISREVSFEVYPYEVISSFVPNELSSGDLEKAPSDGKIRVQFLVYDDNGVLTASDVKYLDGYRMTANFSFELSDGDYTAVAFSDVVGYNGGVNMEFWTFSGLDRLSEIQVNDEHYYGTKFKILGVGRESINVGAGVITHHVNLRPAGALMSFLVWGIHEYPSVISYDLMLNKLPNGCTFTNDGRINVNAEVQSGCAYHADEFCPTDFQLDGGYNYSFFLPLGNTNFMWKTVWTDGSELDLTDVMPLNVEEGKMYQFVLDMSELTYYWGEMGDKSIPSYKGESICRMKNSCYGMKEISEN